MNHEVVKELFTWPVIFVVILFAPLLGKRLMLPVIVVEILFGILMGRSWLNIIPETSELLDFFSEFGLVYLMFLAGLEVDFRELKGRKRKAILIALASIGVPFIAGWWLGPLVGVAPLLSGTILCTTSLGLVLPLSKELGLTREHQHVLLASVFIVDIISIFLLAFAITLSEGAVQAAFGYSFALILLLFLVPWILNHFGVPERVDKWIREKGHFDVEVRFAFALIGVMAALTELLEFHSIMGAFIAGLIISELDAETSDLNRRLESFGYGFFIPLFFLLMGARMDLPLLFSDMSNVWLLILLIVVGISSKAVGVFFASRIAGFKNREAWANGLIHSARLSLIIAAVKIGLELGLVDETNFSLFMILAIASAIIGPIAARALLGGEKKPQPEPA